MVEFTGGLRALSSEMRNRVESRGKDEEKGEKKVVMQ
jgi:hypothetical protein